MFYDILCPKVYGVVTLSMLMWLLFHQNVAEIEDLKIDLNQNEGKLHV